MTVYKFTIWYDNDYEFMQSRYVVAYTEDEAVKKLRRHNERLAKDGFAKFNFSYEPMALIENVIK